MTQSGVENDKNSAHKGNECHHGVLSECPLLYYC